jgi:hypothetical protein
MNILAGNFMQDPMANFQNAKWERNITIFGVVLVALGLLNPSGIVPMIIETYGIRPDYWAFAIIVGMFLKVLSGGVVWKRLVGVLPYTVYVVMAVSLWPRGLTGLLQSQILYVVIWLILCEPLARDVITLVRLWWGKRYAKNHQ